MPRGMLVLTVVCAAFGIGFAARNLVEAPKAPTPTLDGPERSGFDDSDRAAAEEMLDPVEQRALADAPPPAIPPIQAKSNPSVSPPPAAPSKPTTGLSQLAYAPILPEASNPLTDPALAPPAPDTAVPTVAQPPVPPPAIPERTPIAVKTFSAADIDAVRDVIAQMRKGAIAQADDAAKRLADPAAKTIAEWLLARSGLRTVPFARILAFIEKEPSWPTQALLQRRAEEALSAENRPAAAVRVFFAGRDPLTVGGRIALARALSAEGKREDAAALIRKVWREDHFADQTEDRIIAEFPDVLRREDHRARMERYLFKDSIAKAMRAAQRAGADHVALVKARQAVDNKAANAKALLDAVPAALRADSSYIFARAQHARRIDQPVEAVKAMEGVSRDPAVLMDGDEWWVERRLIARKLLDAGNAKLAYKVAAEHGAASDAMRVEAEFHAGWIALQFLRDPATAALHFDKAAEFAKMPMSLSRVAYWQGRAAAARKDMPAAEAHFRRAGMHGSFYYGQLARARLPGVDFGDLASSVTDGRRAELENDRALRAVDLLLSLGEREMAISLIVDLARQSGTTAQLDALGDILTARRDARALLMMGKLAMQRGLALDRHAFPTFGIPSFQPLAEIAEPAIIPAIARQESAFDPRAVSHAGARGLMQLMPATARITAIRFKAPFDVGRLTEDAAYNAQIGAAHLNDLLDEWSGSYILVFAAYNAGSGNAKKWVAAYGDPRSPDVDPIDWIERIPFTETRNYVQRIMENLQVYRASLTPGSRLMIEADLKRGGVGESGPRAKIAGDPPAAPRAQ